MAAKNRKTVKIATEGCAWGEEIMGLITLVAIRKTKESSPWNSYTMQ